MKKVLFLFLILLLCSCDSPTKKPKNLISKEKIAEVIADLAIYEQGYIVQSNVELVKVNAFLLKKHNISANDFKENYTYYMHNPKNLDEIYNHAKNVILEKDPKIKDYLKKKKQGQGIPK